MTGIDELVRQNGSWTRFFRTTTILDAIARYKEQINHMRSDFTLEVVIRIYMKGAEGQRPRHLVHCFYILDATNKTLPVPMHYGYSFDVWNPVLSGRDAPKLILIILSQALEDFVKYRFRNHLGHEVIERGDFSLSLQGVEDEEWQELYKHNSDEWLPLIEPGITITMDIHYEDESYGKPTNPICPSFPDVKH
ncbi:hypothetical protein C0989_004056 [Termitomyces sp. Mn162]|nr:hypothetical protein C0989_004056 [Termitomyces sp. Mn162]